MSCCSDIQILQNPNTITVKQSSDNIQLIQVVQMINICSQSRMPNFTDYSFIAETDGQTVFGPLSKNPVSVITLAITGTLQNQAADTPDFTVSGLYITLNEGIPAGNTVYGVIQTT